MDRGVLISHFEDNPIAILGDCIMGHNALIGLKNVNSRPAVYNYI